MYLPNTHLVIVRSIYDENFTQGKLYYKGKFICHTLEDRVRAPGVKIPGQTAISAGVYSLVVTMSTRFKRPMPLLMDVPQFEGIRLHGGNKPEDTLGCPLCAYHVVKPGHIYGSAEEEVTKLCTNTAVRYIAVIDTQEPL